jgi:hypothetical protein
LRPRGVPFRPRAWGPGYCHEVAVRRAPARTLDGSGSPRRRTSEIDRTGATLPLVPVKRRTPVASQELGGWHQGGRSWYSSRWSLVSVMASDRIRPAGSRIRVKERQQSDDREDHVRRRAGRHDLQQKSQSGMVRAEHGLVDGSLSSAGMQQFAVSAMTAAAQQLGQVIRSESQYAA